jgi:hypothetical protein
MGICALQSDVAVIKATHNQLDGAEAFSQLKSRACKKF